MTRPPAMPGRVRLWMGTGQGATYAGQRDGRRGLPLIPTELIATDLIRTDLIHAELIPGGPIRTAATEPAGHLPPPETAYLSAIDQHVRQRRQRYLGQMVERNAALVVEIHVRAGMVVREHDCASRRRANPPGALEAHVQRLTRSLARWTALVVAARQHAEALATSGEAARSQYWGAVCRHHPVLSRLYAEQNGQFHAEDSRLPGQWWVRDAAGRRVAVDLTRWRPTPLNRDDGWRDPEAMLALARPAHLGPSPLPRALQIIAEQSGSQRCCRGEEPR